MLQISSLEAKSENRVSEILLLTASQTLGKQLGDRGS
jgi:hypothetical protein